MVCRKAQFLVFFSQLYPVLTFLRSFLILLHSCLLKTSSFSSIPNYNFHIDLNRLHNLGRSIANLAKLSETQTMNTRSITDVILNDTTFENVSVQKYMGVTICSNLIGTMMLMYDKKAKQSFSSSRKIYFGIHHLERIRNCTSILFCLSLSRFVTFTFRV